MMQIIENDYPNQIDFAKVPIVALRQGARSILSRSLNPIKVLLSEEGFQRDYRGIAHLAGLQHSYGTFINAEADHMSKVLSLWCTEGDNQTANFDNLVKFLGKIDRWDVADDLSESLAEDAEIYRKKYRRQLAAQQQQVTDESKEIEITPDENILTTDDVLNAQLGLPPQKYDAFVLFAVEDYDFATRLIARMEENHPRFGFKLCVKDRDILGGISFEHEAILRLISERCDRLIVIISPAFLKSSANTFFVNFAAALQIEQRRRKIVPCLYENCQLPQTLSFYYHLKYQENGKLYNFWDKLSDAIRSTRMLQAIPPTPRIQITEVTDTAVEPYRVQGTKMSTSPTIVPNRPTIRTSMSMCQLNNISKIDEIGTDYASLGKFNVNCSQSNLSVISTTKSTGSKPKWFKNLLKPSNSNNKINLPVTNSVSCESIIKPKRKRNWFKKRLAIGAS